MPGIKVAVFYGGVNIKIHKDLLKNECPHIVVGTPGRVLALARDKDLSLKNVRHFILDECDKMLESLGMHRVVFLIFVVYLNMMYLPISEFSGLLIVLTMFLFLFYYRHEERCSGDL